MSECKYVPALVKANPQKFQATLHDIGSVVSPFLSLAMDEYFVDDSWVSLCVPELYESIMIDSLSFDVFSEDTSKKCKTQGRECENASDKTCQCHAEDSKRG